MAEEFRDFEYNDRDKDLTKEEKMYGIDKDALDDKQSQEKNKEEYQENEKGFQTQEKSSCKEGYKDNETETEAGEKESYHKEEISDEAPRIRPDGSYSYVPPRRENAFSKTADERKSDGKEKKKKGLGGAFIALIVAVTIVITIILPLFLMNIGMFAINGALGFGNILDSMFDVSVDGGNSQENDGAGTPTYDGATDDMNVIKNDGSIKVNEQVGSTGYSGDLPISEVVELVADTVVEITTTNVVTDRFYGQYVTSGAGSGVIISENGYIITNNHVIDGARSITVRLTDGSEFSAAVVGKDADKDVALIKINAKGLKAAVLGSSASLVVGQEVVAIGNPLGSLGGTVTDGIISALDRTVVVDGHQMTLMQTNAAINPGNSGGGLFNRAGELIGIVNAKQSDTGIEGLGFAIPIDIAWETVEAIVSE